MISPELAQKIAELESAIGSIQRQPEEIRPTGTVDGARIQPHAGVVPFYRCKVMTVADYLGITNPGEDYRPLFVASATDYTEFDLVTTGGTIETSYDNTVSVTMAEIFWDNPSSPYDFDMFIHDGGTLTGQYQIHFNGQFVVYDTLVTGPSRVTYRAKPGRNYLCIIRDAVPLGISIQMRAFEPEWWVDPRDHDRTRSLAV